MRRSIVLPVLVLGAFILLPAGTSQACTCAEAGRAQAVANADVVFKGTVTRHADPDGGGNVVSSGRQVFYAFDIDEVVKGTVDDPAQVATAAEAASCGARFAVGERYLVMATHDGELLTSNLCAGNEALPAMNPATHDPAQPAPESEGAATEGGSGEAQRRPVLATLAALAAAGGVVALAIGRSRARDHLGDPKPPAAT